MLMFKLEKDTTLKSEAVTSLKQQSTFYELQATRAVMWHAHNSTCTGKDACAEGNYLRIWSLNRKMSSKISEKKCPMCSFSAPTVKLVLSHLRSVHSSDPRFHVMCGIDGCARTYRKYSGLHSHLYRCHWSSSKRISQNLSDTSNTATGVDCMEINQPCNCEQLTMDIIPGM